MLASHAGKLIQKMVDRVATLKIFKKVVYGHAGSREDGRATHLLRVYFNEVFGSHSFYLSGLILTAFSLNLEPETAQDPAYSLSPLLFIVILPPNSTRRAQISMTRRVAFAGRA